MTIQTGDLPKRLQRMESLLARAERLGDPNTQEIIRTILDLHGAGLERILELLADAGETGLATIDTLARDELVGSLLLLYGLHPLDLPTRVEQALEQVRPLLSSHGGNVDLVGVADGIVRLRMLGSCHGCPSSARTLKEAVEQAIYEKAPDVTAIEVEGMEHHNSKASSDDRFALPLCR